MASRRAIGPGDRGKITAKKSWGPADAGPFPFEPAPRSIPLLLQSLLRQLDGIQWVRLS
jgi:hypothetical protein